jgi:lysophospholipase L1-like esterase
MNVKHFLTIVSTVATLGVATAQFDPNTLYVMPVGDSMTSGTDAVDMDGKGGYRAQLEELFQEAGIPFDFLGFRAGVFPDGEGAGGGNLDDEDHEGWSGYYIDGVGGDGKTASLRSALKTFEHIEAASTQVILLLIGSNDVVFQQQGENLTTAQFRTRYRKLLDEIYKQNPFVLVLASTIPPRHPNANTLISNAEIQKFNAVIAGLPAEYRSENNGRRLSVVDGYAAMTDPKNDIRRDAAGSNVLPTDQGYRKLGAMWYRALENVYFDVDPLYQGSVPLGGNWRFSPFFKSFNDQGKKTAGWKFHESLEWIYTPESSNDDLFFYSPKRGWLYTTIATYPNVYSFDNGGWLFFNDVAKTLFNYANGQTEAF